MDSKTRSVVDRAVEAISSAGNGQHVTSVVMKGGPAHESRCVVFLFYDRETTPFAVLKLAFNRDEQEYLKTEYSNLSAVNALWPVMHGRMPKPLAFHEGHGLSWLAEAPVSGRRILVPYLASSGNPMSRMLLRTFLRRTFAWSGELASLGSESPSTIGTIDEELDRFIHLFRPRSAVASNLRAFSSALSNSGVQWELGWQHKDLSVGNVLYADQRLAVLDWENASPSAPPWFDLANSILLLTALADYQTVQGSLTETASWMLDESHWAGHIIASELRDHWDVDLPMSWAIAVTFVQAAVHRSQTKRTRWQEWGQMVEMIFRSSPAIPNLAWLRP